MSTDWQPGDRAVCVEDGWSAPHAETYQRLFGACPLVLGNEYTVIGVASETYGWGGNMIALVLLEAKHPDTRVKCGGFGARRFRKLPPLISEEEREETLELTGRE